MPLKVQTLILKPLTVRMLRMARLVHHRWLSCSRTVLDTPSSPPSPGRESSGRKMDLTLQSSAQEASKTCSSGQDHGPELSVQ